MPAMQKRILIPCDAWALGRLFERVVVSPTGCWVSQRQLDTDGHAQITLSDKGPTVMAHRLTYRMMRGPLRPPPYELDHLCRVRACVNPWHLEQVTNRVNVLRGRVPEVTRARYQKLTHCKYGHPWTPENTHLHPRVVRGVRYTIRWCKECMRKRNRDRWQQILANPELHRRSILAMRVANRKRQRA